MIAHTTLKMETSIPPPHTAANNNSNSPVVPTSSPSSASSPRIRRKPLPPSAFSPRSILSSPTSTTLERDHPTSIAAPQSGTVLYDLLDSPSRRSNTSRYSLLPIDPPPPPPKTLVTSQPQASPEETSIPSFPLPPQYAELSQPKTDEVLHIPLSREEDMAIKNAERPPPLRMDSIRAVKVLDAKKPQSPGNVFTSFFRKNTASPRHVSPGAESSATEISDSQSPSPYQVPNEDNYFAPQKPMINTLERQDSWQSNGSGVSYTLPRRMNSGASGSIGPSSSDVVARCNMLEAELKDISRELAGSIRRELDLEDLVERLQGEAPLAPIPFDRTSDYFSDSGTSSIRHPAEINYKEEMEKIKRESEQQRAQLKVDLSQKWQNELGQRKTLESHVQILESKLSHNRQTTNETSDSSARIRELELAVDDAKRRLVEERQTKENFEDLLTALRVDLEQHRNERDNLRDEVVPNLRSQIEGLESSFGDSQKQAYDFARMQQEIQSLKDENAAISSARKMEQEMMRSGMHFLPQDIQNSSPRLSLIVPKSAGLNRSNTTSGRAPVLRDGSRSASISRPNSFLHRPLPDTPENINDGLNAVEQQRDALHSAVKYLRSRYDHQTRTYEKKIRALESQVQHLSNPPEDTRRGGYEKEVRMLRQEMNLLRKRGDDALDQKWQCEKGLAGLRMDLDRSKQETASLQKLLQARDSDDPEVLSVALENAMQDLQQTRARGEETVASLQHEHMVANQLKESAVRTEALAIQVRQQLDANSSLRVRLISAVESGEQNQEASASQISSLQLKLKRLEDTITTTQLQSESAVMRHEEEIRVLKASHNAQLLRAKAGIKSPAIGGMLSPISPMFANKSPRLDNTSSGPGMGLNQALQTEMLENKVAELEKALGDAEREMEQVVGRMNQAQIGVFELQQERDEAHRRTRKLESEIKAERQHFQSLVTSNTN